MARKGHLPVPLSISWERSRMDEATEMKVRRLAAGLSQRGLAKRLGVSSSAVSRWEGGSRAVDRRTLAKVREITRRGASGA